MTREYFGFLQHHGVQGQKWGVRRYQNEDGTLTEEGRKRYAKEHPEVEKILKNKPWLKEIQDKNGYLTKFKNYYDTPDVVSDYKGYRKETDKQVKDFDTLFKSLEAGPIANAIANSLDGKTPEEKRAIYEQITSEATFFVYDKSITKKHVKDLYKDVDKDALDAAKKIILDDEITSKKLSDTNRVNVKMDIPDYDSKTKKAITSKYTDKEIKQSVNDLKSFFNRMGIPKSNFESFSNKPNDEQLYYMLAIAANMGLM